MFLRTTVGLAAPANEQQRHLHTCAVLARDKRGRNEETAVVLCPSDTAPSLMEQCGGGFVDWIHPMTLQTAPNTR